ncbi:MAG: DUF4254 domain-containing protein [Fibrobacteres bacterium]|nr:DUF4254 domain-containing protein [Fibrobacterota bacterium]
MIRNIIRGIIIADLQDSAVESWHNGRDVIPLSPLDRLILQQHRHNYGLWHEEDEARRTDTSDAVIAKVKRAIDKLNQQRNDCIEKIDDFLISELNVAGVEAAKEASRNSETPGSIIDKLSIISLRIYHMNEQVNRKDADTAHIQKCKDRLVILAEQRQDLSESLTDLWAEIGSGRKRLKVYRQFKMYNDASLNPAVYGANRGNS